MHARIIPALLVAASLAGRAGTGGPERPPGSNVVDARFLDALRAEIRAQHPSAAASRARAAAAHAETKAVRTWEDPTVGAAVMAAERDMRADDGDLMFGVEQMLPRRRLVAAKGSRAAAEYAMRAAETRATEVELEADLARRVIDLALQDESVELEAGQLEWLESMAATVRERLKDPMSGASESLRIEGELAIERQKLDSARRQRVHSAEQLNVLLGRNPATPWAGLRLPPTTVPTPGVEDLLARLQAQNPEIQAQLQAARAARAEQDSARREQFPAFSFAMDMRLYSGGGLRQTTVGAKMNLPWFNRRAYRASVEQARQRRQSAELESEALARRLRGEILAAHSAAENAALQAATIAREVVPRIERAAEATRIAWISSKAGILEVLDSRRAHLNARIEERQRVATHLDSLESLRTLVPPHLTLPTPLP